MMDWEKNGRAVLNPELATPLYQSLWERIETFPLVDATAERPYSLRLMQENAWSEDLAAKVIGEYKRFVFLCLVCNHGCVPSGFVDQAWHLHILYLPSYLFDFCIKTLGRILWHRPSKGGNTERERLHELYSQTWDAYQRWFGVAPPEDVWGRCTHPRHHEAKTVGAGEPIPQEVAHLFAETANS